MMVFKDRLTNAWNAFTGRDPTKYHPLSVDMGYSSSYRPDRVRMTGGNERSIVTSIYNRIAIDVSAVNFRHVKLDDKGNFVEEIKSGIDYILSTEANIDQTHRDFIRDVVISLFDEGCVALVPIDTDISPKDSGAYDIYTMRTGKITEWFPEHVRVNVYNEKHGRKEDLILPKKQVAIIENPFYSVMNEPNSTLQRLVRTLNRIDRTDEANSSGKLDLIIQLPYVVKTAQKREQAEIRRKEIEAQLTGSKYGIAYTDGTERITQLNRAVENNLWQQAQDLTSMLYNQLGITQSILDCTADETVMNNYLNNTIEPILSAIANEMHRKFLTKTARSQGQAIRYFMDPFKLIPVNKLADLADKFTRNEILTSNEMRALVGMKPVNTERANELVNKNINQSKEELQRNEKKNPEDETEPKDKIKEILKE
ncbi:MAG: phage portal protein [Pseudobutyrivibrio sp.]|nr:phage portal protein [Pseudobutyrivibrio sp.]